MELTIRTTAEIGIAHQFALLGRRDHGITVVERRVMIAVGAEREVDAGTARVFEIGKEIPWLGMESGGTEQGQQ